VPKVNPDAAVLAGEVGLETVFPMVRMYTGSVPQIDLSGVYDVRSLRTG
jgi:hypothetical protein